LDRDVFRALRIPFTTRVSQMLRRIARHPILRDKTYHGSFPACWRTLYALAEIDNHALLRAALADGRIHPGLQRKEIRGALGLPLKLSRGARKGDAKPEAPKPALAVVMDSMSDEELTAQLPAALPFDRFLRILSQDWRAKIESRLSKRPHVVTAEAFIRASEILRRMISLEKIAATPPISPAVAASNEKEALTALRQLTVVLDHAGIDEVTIVHQYAKERRCAKDRRGAKGAA
jgi:hypothetical protein